MYPTLLRPEIVREETPLLAPFLLQQEGLIVDILAERLGEPVTAHMLSQTTDELGFIRRALIRTAGLPLYFVTTVISRIPKTRALLQTLRKEPDLPFGEALKRHGLFHHKGEPLVTRTRYLDDYRKLFEDPRSAATELWERSYAIITKDGKRIAGVTEIFSPRLEDRLRQTPERKG